MIMNLADGYASFVESGCTDENILIEAMMCFIEKEQHLDLIPVIASRLPAEQYRIEYWYKSGWRNWNPVFAAVMNCSSIEVFRILRDLGYPLDGIMDLNFYPDPSGFVEIISMNMPAETTELTVFSEALERVLESSVGKNDGCPFYTLPCRVEISSETFDALLSDFIEYGKERFEASSIRKHLLVELYSFIAYNTKLEKTRNTALSWIDDEFNSFKSEEKKRIAGIAIKSGNDILYDYIAKKLSKSRKLIYSADISFSSCFEYSDSFIEELVCDGPLKIRKNIANAISNSMKLGYPSAAVIRKLFKKLGEVKSEDFPAPLSILLLNPTYTICRNLSEMLDIVKEIIPSDFERTDGAGRNSCFYAVFDIQALKFIQSFNPGLLLEHDYEGRNILHFFCMSAYAFVDDPVDIFAGAFNDLLKMLPPELYTEKDKSGNNPFDYLEIAFSEYSVANEDEIAIVRSHVPVIT